MNPFDLVCCVVQAGQGSRALLLAKQHGMRGGTICLGMGTVKNKLLEMLDLADIRKEVVFMIAERPLAAEAMAGLSREMGFHKPNHGIVFSFSLLHFIGTKHYEPLVDNNDEQEAVKKTMYKAIFAIVDKGLAEDVVEAAKQAGARGATIINARGSGIHDTDKVFAMSIEPEKEMVMILTENQITRAVATAVQKQLHIDEPGNGILFILDVNEAHGLY